MANQIKKKYIENDAIDGLKILLEEGQTLRRVESGVEVDVIQNLQDSVSDEETRALAAEGALDGRVTQNESDISQLQSDVAQEAIDRAAADSAIQSDVTALDGRVTQNEGDISSNASAIAQEVLDREATDNAIIADVSSLDGRVTQNESDISSNSSAIAQEIIDRTAADANLQSQIDSILSNTDPLALDSLTEIVSAFQAADSNLNDAITSLSNAATSGLNQEIADREAADLVLQGNIDAEETARIAADNALDARVTTLEGALTPTWIKEKFVYSGSDSVTLSQAPVAGSTHVFVDRLAIHEGASEDYTVSGSSVTFVNDLVGNGNQKLQNGDNIYVRYQYLA